jgi:osmotically-inducible protein OsmY
VGKKLRAATFLAFVAGSGCAGSLRQARREDDPGIARLISLRLASDARLCPYEITPAVVNQTARLEGKVSSDADRRRAEKVARDAGATGVDDRLVVDPAAGDGARC